MGNLDTNIDPNIPESRDMIAAWVKTVGDKAESQGLEVKSSLEFSTRSERNKSYAKITKFILASANRDQKQAIRDYQGYGVMLIGVTQNEVCGLEDIPEQHNFEDATRGYFGSAIPAYRFISHEFEGKNLLFVIVDPPVNGKEIYICSKEYRSQEKGGDQLRDGAIYCRESTQTIEANSVQVRDMINRLLGGHVDINLDISEIFAGPRVDTDFLKNMYSCPKEKYNESLKRIIGNKESNSLLESRWRIKDPLQHVSVEDMFKAYENDEKRYEECFNRLLEIKLKPAIFSIVNTGTKVLEDPSIEYRFSENVYMVNLKDKEYKCRRFEIFPFMAVPQYYYMMSGALRGVMPSNFAQVGNSRAIVWRPGSISPGQTVTSEEDNIGIFVNGDNVNTGVFYRVTDPNLQRPIEGEINVSMINVDPSNIFENVEF